MTCMVYAMKPSPRPQLTSAGRKEVLHDLNQHSEMELLERVWSPVLLGTPVQSIMFFISLVCVEFPFIHTWSFLTISNIYIFHYIYIYLYLYIHISLYIIYMYIFHYILFIYIHVSRSTTHLPSFCFCVAPSKLPIISPTTIPGATYLVTFFRGRISVPFFGALLIPGLGFLVQILEFTAEN